MNKTTPIIDVTKPIFTNSLKKGHRVTLKNGWEADLLDNAKGNIRFAKVFGYCTEMGSVYSHDIVSVSQEGKNYPVVHNEKQKALLASL